MIWCSLKPLKIARAILSYLCCALAHSVLRSHTNKPNLVRKLKAFALSTKFNFQEGSRSSQKPSHVPSFAARFAFALICRSPVGSPCRPRKVRPQCHCPPQRALPPHATAVRHSHRPARPRRCRAAAASRIWPLLRWRLVTPRAVNGCEQQDEGSQGPQLQPKLHWLRFSRRRLAEQYRQPTAGVRYRHSLRAERARQLLYQYCTSRRRRNQGAVRPHASGW